MTLSVLAMGATHVSLAQLQERYAEIKQDAADLAGSLLEIPRRVAILNHLTDVSGGNHLFPLVAAHGALWAQSYFEMGGSLGRLIAKRYFYNAEERIYRLDILREFAESFRIVNRQVCIDTYTNFQFTREHGEAPDAAQIVPGNLLDALNRVHAACRRGHRLSAAERWAVFEQSFLCEQEVTVAPGVQNAIGGFDCRIMRMLCLKPIVRFAYFPAFRYLFFRNFGDTDERVAKGRRAYDFAERVGWERVQTSLLFYGHLPRRFAADRSAYFRECTGRADV